jgi:hypothetical protein
MRYVKCPRCNTENVASRVLCVKCAENLAGVNTYDRFDVSELFSGIRPPLAAAGATVAGLTTEVIEKARLWDEHVKVDQLNRIKTGENTFYAIAGVSLIETIIFWSGKPINFLDSLGITQVLDLFTKGLMRQMPKLLVIPQITAFILDLALAALFAFLGFYAHKSHKPWVFIVGMALYALDMLIVMRFVDVVSTAFHAAALFLLYRALMALREVKKSDGGGD